MFLGITKDTVQARNDKPSTAKIHKEGDPGSGPCVRKSAHPAGGLLGHGGLRTPRFGSGKSHGEAAVLVVL